MAMWIPLLMLLVLASSVLEMISSAMAYDIVPVVAPGTISGHISFSGNPPSPKVFRVQKDPEVCGEKRSLITVDVNAGLVKGVVLTLEGVTQGKPFESKNEKASLLGEGEFQFNGGRSLNLDVQIKGCSTKTPRGGAAAARWAHNPKVAGSSPAPATMVHRLITKIKPYCLIRYC